MEKKDLGSLLSSSGFKNNERLTGIKMLLKLKKAQKMYDNYIDNESDDYLDEMLNNEKLLNNLIEETDITKEETFSQSKQLTDMNEKSCKMIKDLDNMLKDVLETRRQLQLEKEKSKIKTKDDYLTFMNVLPKKKEDEKITDKPLIKEKKNYEKYKDYIIPKNGENQKKYNSIINKINQQKVIVNNIPGRSNSTNKNFITNIKKENCKKIKENSKSLNSYNDDEELKKLFDEINMTNSKMNSYLDEIDKCIELNENINNAIVENNQMKE